MRCVKSPAFPLCKAGTAGQLTSVFTRGLRSEHTQVLLDGIPINQGLAGLMNFADFTTDDIDRVEVVRGPQSTLYGPRALAGAIQIFTKRGEGDPTVMFSAEGRIVRHLSRSLRERRENRSTGLFARAQPARHRQRATE